MYNLASQYHCAAILKGQRGICLGEKEFERIVLELSFEIQGELMAM